MLVFRHRIERAAEFDHVPVAVVPLVQQRKLSLISSIVVIVARVESL